MKCIDCGGEIEYNVSKGKIVCPYCRSEFLAEEYEAKKVNAKENNQKNLISVNTYNCRQCGAKLLTFDETAVTFCSYCGSSNILETKLIKETKPDYVIPFSKTQEECIKEYKKKVSRYLFAPRYLKDDFTISKFRGIFMPYNIYVIGKKGPITSYGEKYSHRSGNYVYYDQYTINANVDISYEGLSMDIASKYYDKFSSAIPFDYNEIKDFKPEYMSGFYADSSDVDGSIYEDEAERICYEDAKKQLLKQSIYKKYNCVNPALTLDTQEKKVGMFPVYFASIKNKNGTYNFAAINGQTGKVAVDIPVDYKKFILYSILLAAIIFLILNNFFTLSPTFVTIISLIFSIISLILSNSQLNKLYRHENHYDDKGHLFIEKEDVSEIKKMSSRGRIKKGFFYWLLLVVTFLFFFTISLAVFPIGTFVVIFIYVYSLKNDSSSYENSKLSKKKMPFKEKFTKYLYKQFLALLFCIVILIFNPIVDEYFYIASWFTLMITLWSFFDLIKEHNLIVSEKLPQLDIRGGDEK